MAAGQRTRVIDRRRIARKIVTGLVHKRQSLLSLRAPVIRTRNADGRIRRGGRCHHLLPRNALRLPLIQIAGQPHAVRTCRRPVHDILRQLRRRQSDPHIFQLMIRSVRMIISTRP